MKSYLFLLCLIAVSFANAQFSAGQKLISGQLNVSTDNYTSNNSPGSDQKNSYGGISLSFSKFKSPLRLIGFGIQYSFSDTRFNSSSSSPLENKNNVAGIFIELTKLQPIAKKMYLSFSGMGVMNYGVRDTYYANNTRSQSKGYNLYINGGMGLWYQLTNRFILTGNVSNLLSVNYSTGNTASYTANNIGTADGSTSSFTLSTGLSSFSLGNFGFGVKYVLK